MRILDLERPGLEHHVFHADMELEREGMEAELVPQREYASRLEDDLLGLDARTFQAEVTFMMKGGLM
ncbi:MAG: hypothetical protein CGU28_00730 [Candidatus Dactylopiibacterium carminicum]|uniref:Uncharacterized protein n=1 Tax=Candidatus Dactylopiibacterium carminicum TaxID=857335 RepID=A0A272EYT4_9RHOO|nr:hypothetical protein [Candidatus Dactylopiibacterium carminicum]KAF7600783.1 hypothetical protein BGI27_00045 [Candidatus Dactylopiibacterium carminicum]PAS95282.1 MAG: hypothetical protein CGU29_00080 [Candidatus Dactylopiibacterium carminicum]PAS98707.1 MAG: hypothetical protein CGU28_00730 [Candidatus Dactylopiibacterium carminicum]PAT00789.1 MAG: hypothetical protein BSR46_00045 [Candidatus Dactylopiibacterium carminicum]